MHMIKKIKRIYDEIQFDAEFYKNTISDVIRNKNGETIGYKNEKEMEEI